MHLKRLRLHAACFGLTLLSLAQASHAQIDQARASFFGAVDDALWHVNNTDRGTRQHLTRGSLDGIAASSLGLAPNPLNDIQTVPLASLSIQLATAVAVNHTEYFTRHALRYTSPRAGGWLARLQSGASGTDQIHGQVTRIQNGPILLGFADYQSPRLGLTLGLQRRESGQGPGLSHLGKPLRPWGLACCTVLKTRPSRSRQRLTPSTTTRRALEDRAPGWGGLQTPFGRDP